MQRYYDAKIVKLLILTAALETTGQLFGHRLKNR